MVRYPRPRNAKLTVLVPQGMIDDLKALRTSTFQSTGDLVNQLIQAELDRQQDAVKEGYEFLKIQESRREKAEERKSFTRDLQLKPSEESGSTETIKDVRKVWPTASDIDEWSSSAKSSDEVVKRKADATKFLEWALSSEEPISEGSSSKYYETVLSKKFKERTAMNHRAHIVGFIRWWNAKLCS